MKKYIFLYLIFNSFISAHSQIIDLSIWNNIRNSAYTIDDSMHIRCETIELPNIETELFYFDGDQWQCSNMELYNGLTYEGVIPELYGGAQTCRFRTEADTLVGMMPALILDDNFPPEPEELSFVADDVIGDNLDPVNTNLDITGNYFGYSDSRFYSAITSDSGTYPLNSGGLIPSSFYFYITLIINPESVLLDSAGYAMVYGNIPILLPQGLYRINGTEISLETLQLIGDLEAQVVDNTLIMACDLETLVNDEYFGDWPSITNSLIVEMATATFSLPDVFLLTDYAKFSLQFIDQYVIEPFTNVLPELSDCLAVDDGISSTFNCTYFDENRNFPLVAEVEVEGTYYELLSILLDYSEPVGFFTEIPVSGWQEATFRFSDNGYEFVEETIQNGTGITNNHLPINGILLSNYPNPFNPSTTISFSSEQIDQFELEIYNLKGQNIKNLSQNLCHTEPVKVRGTMSVVWDGTNDNNKPVSSGIYFYKLKTGKTEITKKMLLMK
jgi:hypothetical protein